LQDAFYAKGKEFERVLKMGRTHLQDAVPMSLGQEFHGWGTTIGEEVSRIAEVRQLLHEINLGATAIGTSVTAAPGYPELVTRYLSELTGTASSLPATWSRRPPIPAPMCSCPACSSAPRPS
jgi:aspartate ammonia-lyase